MFEALSRQDRLLLLKFVCAFAWVDLEVTDAERRFVERLVERLELEPSERAEVERWLSVAPSPQSVEPALIPAEHRRTFIETLRAVIYADGGVDEEERQRFEALKEKLHG